MEFWIFFLFFFYFAFDILAKILQFVIVKPKNQLEFKKIIFYANDFKHILKQTFKITHTESQLKIIKYFFYYLFGYQLFNYEFVNRAGRYLYFNFIIFYSMKNTLLIFFSPINLFQIKYKYNFLSAIIWMFAKKHVS